MFAVVDSALINTQDKVLLQYATASSAASYPVPQGTLRIGAHAFAGSIHLTEVILPDSVTDIGEWAFSECTNLTSVNIPDSVTTIGEKAFYYCESLRNVTLPASLTDIAWDAFLDCPATFSVSLSTYAEKWCLYNWYTYEYVDADPEIDAED